MNTEKETALAELETLANKRAEAVAAVHAAQMAIRNARLQLARASQDSTMAHIAYNTQFQRCTEDGYILQECEGKICSSCTRTIDNEMLEETKNAICRQADALGMESLTEYEQRVVEGTICFECFNKEEET